MARRNTKDLASSGTVDIGPYNPDETDELGRIFFDAVHVGAAAFYTDAQRHAWAPVAPSGPDWASRLHQPRTFVARRGGRPIGFITLDDDGYIDLAFVDPAHQRKGIGSRLYATLEETARSEGLKRIHTQASLQAKGLFERNAWQVVREQHVERNGVLLSNSLMEKRLVPDGRVSRS